MAIKGSGKITPTPYTWGEAEYTKPAMSALWATIEAAIALYSAYTAMKLADQQMDLARRYYDIAKGWWDWYRSAYVPLENAEVDEAMALPIRTPLYDIAVGRAKATARFTFRNRLDQTMRCTSQYATGVRGARLLDEVKRQSYTMAAVENMGWRNERSRIDILNSRRWGRREAVVNRGRDLMANNVTYGQAAGAILGDLAGQVGKAAGGALYAMGYTLSRNETQYNPYIHYNGVQRRGRRDSQWVQPDSQLGFGNRQVQSSWAQPDSQLGFDYQAPQKPFVQPDSQLDFNDRKVQSSWAQPDSQISWGAGDRTDKRSESMYYNIRGR